MKLEIVIRPETSADIEAIAEVTRAAFETLEISNQTEPFIIEALRAAKALTLSLVAELDGRVVGHVAFSPVSISDGTQEWYGLGPVSVLPEYQRRGIGTALIQEGLSRPGGAVWWDILRTTSASGSRTFEDSFMRACLKRFSSPCLLMVMRRRESSSFTKDSKRMANKDDDAPGNLAGLRRLRSSLADNT